MRNTFKISIILISISLLSLFCSKKVLGKDTIISLKDKKIISFKDMIEDISKFDIIVVGELHDSKSHHDFQLKVIQALWDKEPSLAIGLEMFRQDSQKYLNDWTNGQLEKEDFIKIYYENWKTGWPLYADILTFARDRKIPLIGLNIPSEITKKVAQKGFASLTKEELKKLPEGVTCDISQSYMAFIKRTHSFHHTGETEFVNFCEAQMLWDKAMAINAIKFKESRNIKKIIILTGRGHAWKHALPEQIKKLSKYTVTVILPELPGDEDQPILTLDDADYLF